MQSRALAVLAFVAFLAGCAGPAPGATPTEPEAGLPFLPDGQDAQRTLRFTANDYEATVAYAESYSVPQPPCINGATSCTGAERRIDLTSQVPPNAPVELAATATSDVCVSLDLEVEGANVHRISSEFGGPLAALLVRDPSGTVTLLLTNCSFLSSDATSGEAAVDVEVRTAVRSDVVPAYLPVAVDLALGDSLSATGDGLETLVVVAQGEAPLHLPAGTGFNVTPELGAGTYVVVALGTGDVRLAGPNATLRALPLHVEEGERHPLSSGATASWDFTVPGVPLFVGIAVRTQESPTEVGSATLSGSSTWVLAQQDIVLAEWDDSDSLPIPTFSFGGTSRSTAYAPYLDERMTAAPFTASVTYDVVSGYDASHIAGWVEP